MTKEKSICGRKQFSVVLEEELYETASKENRADLPCKLELYMFF